jgi:archaellum component FlaC
MLDDVADIFEILTGLQEKMRLPLVTPIKVQKSLWMLPMDTTSDYSFLQQVEERKKDLGPIPDITCPSIDRIKKDLKDALYEAKNISRNIEDVDHVSHMICYNVDAASEGLEDLRKQNEQLRDLGKEWYKFAKYIAGEYDKYQEYSMIEIEELRLKIAELQARIEAKD